MSLKDTLDEMDIFIFIEPFIPEHQNIHSSPVHVEYPQGQTITMRHKTSLNKFEKIEIILSILSDHNVLKQEINCKKDVKNPINMWRLTNMLLK